MTRRIYEVLDEPDRLDNGSPCLVVRPSDGFSTVVAFAGNRIMLSEDDAKEYLRGKLIRLYVETDIPEIGDDKMSDETKEPINQELKEYAGTATEIFSAQLASLSKTIPSMSFESQCAVASNLVQPALSALATAAILGDIPPETFEADLDYNNYNTGDIIR